MAKVYLDCLVFHLQGRTLNRSKYPRRPLGFLVKSYTFSVACVIR